MDTNSKQGLDDWIARLKSGDVVATQELVEAFYDRLVGLAKHRLGGLPPQVADEEGAVISALRSFFSGIKNGGLSQVQDNQDLWRVLATITARKAIRQWRVYQKQSGEGGKITRGIDLQNLVSRQPAPEVEAQILEEFQQRIDSLDNPVLKKIVWLKLEGLETSEIAERLSLHVRSIQRKLKLVESTWLEDNKHS